MLHFDGRKDPARRVAAEGAKWPLSIIASPEFISNFRPYRKTPLTYAARMTEPFEVATLEGLHTGRAGDYLAIGVHGEMYPIDAAVFEATYEPV